MKVFSCILVCQFTLVFPILSNGQTTGEWLVEMNTVTGSFQPVGPILEDIFTIYVGLQCKDEINGQYIFMSADPLALVSVDISNGEIIHQTPNPITTSQIWGLYCINNCDTLLLLGRDNMAAYTYIAHFDRFNGTEVIAVGDSIPDDDPGEWNLTFLCQTFDPVNNHFYMYSNYGSFLRIVDALTGNILETYTVSASPSAMAFDEVNDALYALEPVGVTSFKLLRFNYDSGDFIQIGDMFTTIGAGHLQTTIDGNNQRLFMTRSGVDAGSFMTSVDLTTGELLADVQTMPGSPGGGIFGGPNTINGRYFNSTNQLITLHWGDGDHVTTTYSPADPLIKARIYPNPNQGTFRLEMNKDAYALYDLQIVNLTGQLIYESKNIREVQTIHSDLSSGYYIAHVLSTDGAVNAKIPFIVDSGK